ncbi:MAG: alkaline phosphatase family protein [Acholeplasma sp.]|nr:alkaline phosphatase family protein [Acholeplasma sp.]
MFPNYTKSILNVSTTLLDHYGVNTHHATLDVLKPYIQGKKHIMLILLDGMGINILNNVDSKTLFRKNVKTALTSVYPPTTVAATTSVLSGLTPYEHGHVGWTQYNRFEDCHTVVFLNKDFYDETHVLKDNFKDTHLKYETILEKIQRQNPSLYVKKLFPDFEIGGFKSFDLMVDALIQIQQKEASFTYTYWTEPDYTIHDEGVFNDKVKAQVQYLNDQVERLYQNVSKDTCIIVIADHGLVDVEGIPLYNHPILDLLDRKPSVEPRSTAFFVKKGQEQAFEAVFKSNFNNQFTLLKKSELYDQKLLGFGEKHPLLDDFIGDYMALSHDKYMFNIKEQSTFKAHHAGIHEDEMMVPLIILTK